VEDTFSLRYHVGMKTVTLKTIRTVDIKPKIKKAPTRPMKKTGLSKSDPDYYSKIGAISAARRNISSEQFREWAKLSHPRKNGHKGGRKKKDAGNSPLAKLDRDLRAAVDQ
jgi:hypothetical protein